MGEGGDGVIHDVDTSVPSVARMYDYALGGKDNYAADRAAFDRIEAAAPSTRPLAVNNRRFLGRAVRVLAEDYGVRQFLDLGSGLPTQDNVHQIAQRVDADARVVYVDHDPIVSSHGRALLEGNANTAVVHADLRDVDGVFGHPRVRRLLDPARPVAVLLVAVLECVPDADDPAGVVKRIADRLPSGSFLVVNQLVSDDPVLRERMTRCMVEVTRGRWGRVREREDVRRYFEGLRVLEPGLVENSSWRPDSELGPKQLTEEWIGYGGVGRKP